MTHNPFSMAGWVPLKERVELTLIFMVAASVGEVVLASRGFTVAGYVCAAMIGGFVFSVLWVLPKLSLSNIIRTLVLGYVWSVLFTAVEVQVRDLMMPQAPEHEVFSR
jgi:hypothetical protein